MAWLLPPCVVIRSAVLSAEPLPLGSPSADLDPQMKTFPHSFSSSGDALWVDPAGETLNLHPPVGFDPTLTDRLLGMHDALNSRFAAILCMLDRDPAFAVAAIGFLASELQDLRRAEAMWIYPLIAKRIDADVDARRQLMRLRISLLAELRAILRLLGEMSQALQAGTPCRSTADLISGSMATFLRRGETEIYPLYNLVGSGLLAPRVA